MIKKLLLIFIVICCVEAQSYDDARCKCLCPNPSVVNGTNRSNRKLYIGNGPPNKCNCDGVILPQLGDDLKGKEQEFCPRCECKYENRNTAIIKVVVIIVIWVISLLCIYMLFLMCLDPLLNKKAKGSYLEHTNEEDDTSQEIGPSSHPMGVRRNVLNRVGHQQDKWKKQVREQRKIIYDRHTMLN
ncbi:hypothetical protein RUM44_009756 [Polyplax serrata]|uniref:Uncharacterized protein n=1 Tax=Polyplax serrata TaxID=468196 RepID=A0ABR1ATL0_POLSC